MRYSEYYVEKKTHYFFNFYFCYIQIAYIVELLEISRLPLLCGIQPKQSISVLDVKVLIADNYIMTMLKCLDFTTDY